MPRHASERWALAIEASNPSADPDPGMASVAGARLLPDGSHAGRSLGPITEISYRAASRDRDGLLPAIESVRAELGVEPGGLDLVCVSVGPGGYTGLRVSVTVAKSLAMATGAGLVGVPSATVAVGVVGDGGDGGDGRPGEPFLVCLASKGDRTHVTAFAEPGTEDGEPIGVLDAEGVAARMDGGGGGSPRTGEKVVVGDRFLPQPIRLACLDRGGRVLAPRFSASRCLQAGHHRERVAPSELVPFYAREPEAVRLWRGRQIDRS